MGGTGEDNEILSSLSVFLFPKEPVLLFMDLLLFNTSMPLNLLDICVVPTQISTDSPDKLMVSTLEVHRNHKARHLEEAP